MFGFYRFLCPFSVLQYFLNFSFPFLSPPNPFSPPPGSFLFLPSLSVHCSLYFRFLASILPYLFYVNSVLFLSFLHNPSFFSPPPLANSFYPWENCLRSQVVVYVALSPQINHRSRSSFFSENVPLSSPLMSNGIMFTV